MPEVRGKQLDVALSEIKRAGFGGEVDVDSPGLFGVVDETNWQVCEQTPGAGEGLTGAPKLSVERSCEGTDQPGETPSGEPSEVPATTEPLSPVPTEALTAATSKEFAAVLAAPDYCSESIARFAKKNQGRVVEFDGSIVALTKSGDAKTRFDILVAPGNKGSASTVGPAFQFQDVNMFDLNLAGAKAPDTVGVDDRFRFAATIERYEADSCLLVLEPESTKAR